MSYPPLNNITAPDAYTTAAQIISPTAARFNLKIANQAIYVQLGDASHGVAISWRFEEFFTPGFYSLDHNADAIQIRAAIPAAQIPTGQVQAQVTVSAYPPAELT